MPRGRKQYVFTIFTEGLEREDQECMPFVFSYRSLAKAKRGAQASVMQENKGLEEPAPPTKLKWTQTSGCYEADAPEINLRYIIQRTELI